jgi:hypothetical protein
LYFTIIALILKYPIKAEQFSHNLVTNQACIVIGLF